MQGRVVGDVCWGTRPPERATHVWCLGSQETGAVALVPVWELHKAGALQHLIHIIWDVFVLCFTLAKYRCSAGFRKDISGLVVLTECCVLIVPLISVGMVKYLQLWRRLRWSSFISCLWGHHALNQHSKMLTFVEIIMGSARLYSLIWEKGLEFK